MSENELVTFEEGGQIQVARHEGFVYLYTLEVDHRLSRLDRGRLAIKMLNVFQGLIGEGEFGLMHDSTSPENPSKRRYPERNGWKRVYPGDVWFYYDPIKQRAANEIKKISNTHFDI